MGILRYGPLLFLLQALLTDILPGHQIFVQSESFSAFNDELPVLAVKTDDEYTLMRCTIRRALTDSEVFFACPTFDRGTYCYEGCKPTKTCPRGDTTRNCVPDGQTVECQKSEFANRTVVVSLKIEISDSRLHGLWHCVHAGKESLFYEVTPKVVRNDSTKTSDKPPREVLPVSAGRSEQAPHFRQPAVIFTILAILGLSLLINMAFCVRCVMIRSYIDSLNTGKSSKCLAGTLCLPNELRKPLIPQKEPLLPRLGAWGSLPPGDHLGYHGSYHGSTQLMPQVNSQPVFLHPHTYTPTGSTTGAYRTHIGSQPRIYAPPFQNEFVYTPAMENAEMISLAQPIVYGNGAAASGVQLTHGLPSFIRNPSIKLPSPNPSQRGYLLNNPSPSLLRVLPGSEGQSTYVVHQQQQQQRPAVFGGHVVYDDVSAAAANRLNMGDPVQNEASPYAGAANQTATKGLTKFYAYPLDNNQSTALLFPSSTGHPVPPQANSGNTFVGSNISSPENNGTEHVGTSNNTNNAVPTNRADR